MLLMVPMDDDSGMTLDPPGSIIVIGTTPLGLEAALYGRYLGYDVRVIAGADAWASPDRERIGPRFLDDWFAKHWLGDRELASVLPEPMPMMPDRCLSSLAAAAITTQDGESVPRPLPITMQQWIDDALVPLCQTDLMRGRVDADAMIQRIALIPVEDDSTDDVDDELDGEIPPDFGFSIRRPGDDAVEEWHCECVIVADMPEPSVPRPWDPATGRRPDYWFEITTGDQADAAAMLLDGYRQIARIFASLAGRDELDLYRPLRL